VANDFLRVNHRYPPNWIGTENHANNAVEKHFPATPSGELCDADCGCPSPEAREVRLKVYLQDGEVRGGRRVMRFEGQPLYVEFTPADAKRIGILGGWRDA